MNVWNTRHTRAWQWGAVLAVAVVVSVFVATQAQLRPQPEATWRARFFFQLAYWSGWALLSPFVFYLARQYPIAVGRSTRAGSVFRGVLVHLAAALVVSTTMLLYFAILISSVVPSGHPDHEVPLLSVFLRYMGRGFHYDFVIYGAILAVGIAMDLRRRVVDRTLRAARLEARLSEAKLGVLRTQLRPHFLFNTLHSIAALCEGDPKAARRMIAQLSDLLRATLDRDSDSEISLRDELDLVKRYVEIEETRFPDRVELECEIEEGCLDAHVPNLLLQPLVENSLRHGILDRPQGGKIRVSARRLNGDLELRVVDDGIGMVATPGSVATEGVGLANARERLRCLYGDGGALSVSAPGDGGFCVDVRLPFRPMSVGPGCPA